MKKIKFMLNIQFFADGGDGADGGAAAGGNQTIDYAKIEEIVNKRSLSASDSALKGYLKEMGLTGEELNNAVTTFKQQKEAAKKEKEQEYQRMMSENEQLKSQILNSSIESKLASLAIAEGVKSDKIPFLSKLIDRKGLTDDKGNVLEDKIKEAMKVALDAFPDFKGNPDNNDGFQQIGNPGNSKQNLLDDRLDAIFGIKK